MSPSLPQHRAERIHATAVFADLVGFAALVAKSGTETAYLAATQCLRLLDEAVRKHGGSVDKYSGDKLMAVFGYPLPLPNHPAAALGAALEMHRRVAEYNRETGLEPPFGLHVGVNTGDIVAGDIRGPVVREFHVLGDAVNVSARLNAEAPVGTTYVGETTRAAAGEAFGYRELPPFQLKGKSRSVLAFELLGATDVVVEGEAGEPGGFQVQLVGRDAEIASLREAASSLERGGGQVIAIQGAEGSGKSRLLAELASLPELAEARVLQVRCAQVDRDIPLAAIAGLVQAWIGARVSSFAEVKQLMPRLLGAAAESPHVLFFEDAHLLDPDSLAVLEALAPAVADRPILIALTFQPEPEATRERLESLTRRAGAGASRAIELAPLDADSAGRLIDLAAGETQLDPETRALVQERAAGNPGRLLMGAFAADALRSEREQEDRQERRSERTRDAERRRVAVLFADISGFTAMTEKVGASTAYPVVAGALGLLDEVSRKHGGTVDHYLGDCVMALFGVPEALEDAPRAAVNAAIEMRSRIEAYNGEHGLAQKLSVHSGVATGLGIAGDISGPLIREFAVMGDHVDLADQLTHLAESGEVYVDAETHRFTDSIFEYADGRSLQLPGSADPIPTHAVLSTTPKLYRARVGAERGVFSALVGREEEFAILRSAAASLDEGRGGIATLIAEAGVGKSRLIAELAASEEAGRAGWLEGRSLSTGRNLSFHPFADLVRSWARITDEDDALGASAKLGEAVSRLLPDADSDVLPFVQRIAGVTLAAEEERRLDEMPSDTLERSTRRALTQLLRAEARQRALVVVMDDLHWADQSSIELLESLLRLAEEEAILFLLVTRPGFAASSGRLLEAVRERHKDRHREIALEPLEPRAVRQMVRNLFRGGDVPYETRNLIEERARGNPFYIEEVVRSLVDLGAVEYRDGAFHATRKLQEAAIPGTVQEVVMARVDLLSPGPKAVLQAASVVGGTFHASVVEEMVADPDALRSCVGSLLQGEFIVPSDRAPGEEYAFKHPLTQEVTYDALLQGRREELHLAAGEAIETRLSGEVAGVSAMLAYHFAMGSDAERAEEYLFKAGDEASRSAASSEALNFFQDASKLYFQLHGDGGDPAKKSLLEQNVGLALFNRGREPEAVGHFDAALEFLGIPVAKTPLKLQLRFLADLVAILPRLYVGMGRRKPSAHEQDLEVIEIMAARARAQTTADPTRFLFDTMALIRRVLRYDPHTIPQSGEKLASPVGIFSYGGLSLGMGRRFLRLADPLLADRPHAPDYMFYSFMRFLQTFLEGDWSVEFETPDEIVAEHLRAGRLWDVVSYLGLLAEKRVRCGDFEGYEAAYRMLLEIGEGLEYQNARLAALGDQLYLLVEQGRSEEAIAAAEDYYEESPQDLLHLLALGAKAEAQLQRDDLEAAGATLAAAEEIYGSMGFGQAIPYHASFYLVSRLLHDVVRRERQGERAVGARALRRTRRAALQSCAKVATRRPQVYRLAGREAWLLGQHGEALSQWQLALAEAERLGQRPEYARTCHEIGLRLGDGEQELEGRSPASLLEAARAAYTDLGLSRDLARLEAGLTP